MASGFATPTSPQIVRALPRCAKIAALVALPAASGAAMLAIQWYLVRESNVPMTPGTPVLQSAMKEMNAVQLRRVGARVVTSHGRCSTSAYRAKRCAIARHAADSGREGNDGNGGGVGYSLGMTHLVRV